LPKNVSLSYAYLCQISNKSVIATVTVENSSGYFSGAITERPGVSVFTNYSYPDVILYNSDKTVRGAYYLVNGSQAPPVNNYSVVGF
jgi:hypothetical protein